jgi:putative ABC transport system ATP-binding protein
LGAGEFVAIAGRSGSGKTTLLNIAAGLYPPDQGEIRWFGDPIAGLTAGARAQVRAKRMGIVFQLGGLLEQLTAVENVSLVDMPRHLGRDGRARAREMLAQVGLGDRQDHFPAQLSGGERQRVALARALYAEPDVLIVDEPTGNLDLGTGAAIAVLLASLKVGRRALLVASHDPDVLRRADRVLDLAEASSEG